MLNELRSLVVQVLPDPLVTDTVDRFNSITPSAIPLTYNTTSGRFVDPAPVLPTTVTSSATVDVLFNGCAQSINSTVSVSAPCSGFTFTP